MKIKIQFLKQVRQIYARKLGTQKSPDLNGLGSFNWKIKSAET